MVSMLLLGAACSGEERALAPLTLYGAGSGAGSAGMHTVSGGETLYRISERYNLPMRDIIAINDLSPPYMLDVGQRLKLPPPREYTVRAGDTLYGISRLFSAGMNDVARLNDLRAPYTLKTGQTLRLPSPSDEESVATRVTPVRTASPSATTPVPPGKPAVSSGSSPRTPVTEAAPKRASSRFLMPVSGPVISTYGPKKDGLHNDGINIRAPKGTPVRAAENGVVVYAGRELEGYGNLVLVRHADRWMTAYAHLDKVMAARGARVERGATLGTVGSSGSVDEPQLHFEIRRGTEALNPKRYLE
ncbi:MAG: M23 family metallopeptidase [Alphaproteobacteria bacterium]|nr:M23 family metallopeptidase [Alphaproteobacteria bacterium]